MSKSPIDDDRRMLLTKQAIRCALLSGHDYPAAAAMQRDPVAHPASLLAILTPSSRFTAARTALAGRQ
jgi:hypothetical protein